jgi:hypothetical protein
VCAVQAIFIMQAIEKTDGTNNGGTNDDEEKHDATPLVRVGLRSGTFVQLRSSLRPIQRAISGTAEM